jgi:hypothetical protein
MYLAKAAFVGINSANYGAMFESLCVPNDIPHYYFVTF